MAGRTKLRVSKNFFGGYVFAFVEYLCNCSLKIKTKKIKNYSSILAIINHRNWQRWSRGHKARGQGQGYKKNPRPKPRPRTAFPRTDALEAKDRNARGQGQGQECSRPRTKDTSASALQTKRSSQKFFWRSPKKKKKKVFTKIFQAISTNKRFPKDFSTAPRNFNNSKNSAVLEAKDVLEDSTSGNWLDDSPPLTRISVAFIEIF